MKTLTEFSTVMLRRGADARAAKTAEGVAAEAMAEALATTLALPADRAARLIEALDIVGADVDKVRLVRVFQGEKGPTGATSVGEFHYALDRVGAGGGGRPRRDDRGSGGRGGDRGGGGGGGRGGGGGGGGGGGFGGFGDRKGPPKPRGLGSLMAASSDKKPESDDDRPRSGEIPRAGMGWVLTAAPREARDNRGGGRGPGRGPGGPRRDRPGGRGPGGPGGDRPGGRGPGGPGPARTFAGGPGGANRGFGAGPGGPGGGQPGDAAAGPGGPGGERLDGRGPRRGGRGRGPGGPGGPGGGGRGPGGGGRGPGGPRDPGPVNQPEAGAVQAATEAPPAPSVTPPDDSAKS